MSITNPSEDSPLEYFKGKAVLERALKESGLSYAILRPTVIFGEEDILINNIAWTLRRFPIFGVFGDGLLRVVELLAENLTEQKMQRQKLRRTGFHLSVATQRIDRVLPLAVVGVQLAEHVQRRRLIGFQTQRFAKLVLGHRPVFKLAHPLF